MAKDPAFLFYSKDFYEGTRMMLPEERACYIDLLIYQHQNGGFIPTDIRRVLMYCGGISEATLIATLEAKFKLCDKGYFNEKLQSVMNDRQEHAAKQSVNGTIGQFFKKAKSALNIKKYNELRDFLKEKYSNQQLYELIIKHETDEARLEAMLKLCLSIAPEDANADAIGIADAIGKGKGGVEEKEKPDFTKPDTPGDTVVMPFETEPMRKLWASWKAARWATHGVRYPMNGEQADLRRMQGMTFQQVEETIQAAIAAGWKNLYPEKNGTTKPTSKKQQRQQGIAESIAKRYGADSPVWKNE